MPKERFESGTSATTERQEKSKKAKSMRGAVYSSDKTPDEYVTDPATGKRPHESREPWGTSSFDLRNGFPEHLVLPTFEVWEAGKWAGVSGADWYTWLVSGEGTPGNYEERAYKLPDEIASQEKPKHPTRWPASLRERRPSGGWRDDKVAGLKPSYGDAMPFGIRVRCPGCGHFFRVDDLSGHAKAACPATQPEPAMFVLACECCDSLQQTATTLPGFPVVQSHEEEKPDAGSAAE